MNWSIMRMHGRNAENILSCLRYEAHRSYECTWPFQKMSTP